MELWTAFIIGLAGSLHCIGMCGPIAIALPQQDSSKSRLLIGRVLYNFGRVITYAILGLIFGFIGKGFFIGGYQQILSITLGILILLALILPGKYASYLTGARLHGKINSKIRGLWKKFMKLNSLSSLFIVGLLNGFLPCGLVYIALAGSISTGNAASGALYMTVFGMGTFPVMLAMSLVGKMLSFKMKLKLRKLLPVGAVLLAALFILRGLSLGIPYISPKIEQQEDGQTTVDCCHQKSAPEEFQIK